MTEATRRGAASGSGADLTPFRTIAESVSASGGELVDQVSALIDKAQAFAASQVNATLTLRNWYIGRLIDVAVLREGRAGHDQELVASLGRQLTARYGRGFDRANLYRMVQFSQAFPDVELVASLGQQVSWTHFKALLPVPSSEARAFYVKRPLTADSAFVSCGTPSNARRTNVVRSLWIEGREVQAELPGPDELLPEMARPTRTSNRREPADRSHPVHRDEP